MRIESKPTPAMNSTCKTSGNNGDSQHKDDTAAIIVNAVTTYLIGSTDYYLYFGSWVFIPFFIPSTCLLMLLSLGYIVCKILTVFLSSQV